MLSSRPSKDVSRRPIEPTPASDLIADLGFDSLQVMETAGWSMPVDDLFPPTR